MPILGRGPYHVLVQCDVLNEVAEANEENNVLDIGQLTLGPCADLVISSGEIQPPAISPNVVTQVRFRVENIGVCHTGSCWTHVYLSPDNSYDPSDFLWIQGIGVGPLGQGEAFDYSMMTQPSFHDDVVQYLVPILGRGPYHVLVQCDVLNEVLESNEQNNICDIGTLELPTRAGRWTLYR